MPRPIRCPRSEQWRRNRRRVLRCDSASRPSAYVSAPGQRRGNPQTDALLDLLELTHVVTIPYENTFRSSQEDPNFNSLPKQLNQSKSVDSNYRKGSDTGATSSLCFFEDFGDEDNDKSIEIKKDSDPTSSLGFFEDFGDEESTNSKPK